jgi:IS30 family transposase
MSDPFEKIRRLADEREQADESWRQEVRALRAAGFSTRAIAEVAGVSHDTVWKVR